MTTRGLVPGFGLCWRAKRAPLTLGARRAPRAPHGGARRGPRGCQDLYRSSFLSLESLEKSGRGKGGDEELSLEKLKNLKNLTNLNVL